MNQRALLKRACVGGISAVGALLLVTACSEEHTSKALEGRLALKAVDGGSVSDDATVVPSDGAAPTDGFGADALFGNDIETVTAWPPNLDLVADSQAFAQPTNLAARFLEADQYAAFGRCTSVESYWIDNQIYSTVGFEEISRVRGTSPLESVIVMGGTIDGVTHGSDNTPLPLPGERYLLTANPTSNGWRLSQVRIASEWGSGLAAFFSGVAFTAADLSAIAEAL